MENLLSFANIAFAHSGTISEETINYGDSFMMGHHGFGMFGGFGMWFGWLLMILFWVLVVLGTVALVKWIMSEFGGKNESKSDNHKNKVYVCSECGYEYDSKEWAVKCQKWCSENDSCNLEITKHGRK